jgi:predicted PurR-regulated permease PerM
MAIIGLPNAAFWAFLIFVAVFVPVIGGAIGTVLPPLFALVQFPTFWPALFLFIGLEVIMFVVGNVIQPSMQRDSLNIDPVVVLLSLAFWGAIWGIPGMFLSTPLTVTGIIVLSQFEGSRWIAVLLSGDGAPEQEPVLRRPRRASRPTEVVTEA